ncbi:MAG TPA: penicillin-binding transpeptidase domain-containing protein [Acidimicrobiales bacterium]|nr:penicillin-binding transpeptidase domain-containing protein [Acidimicrobiales bacterium]
MPRQQRGARRRPSWLPVESAAIVAMEQTTGRIVALHGPVDVARQAGSAFLPFTMAAALEAGVSATEPLAAAHQTAPPGSSESAGGDAEDASDQSASITDALVKSANVPWLQLHSSPPLTPETVTGRTWPARIWKLFVQEALPGEDRGAFRNPARASPPVDSESRRPHLAG